MTNTQHHRIARVSFVDLLDLMNQPGPWLDAFALVAAARGESAGKDLARRIGSVVPATPGPRRSEISLGDPIVRLDRWQARIPFAWETAGYGLLFARAEGTIVIAPDEGKGTAITIRLAVDDDPVRRHAATTAAKMLLETLSSAVEATHILPA